MSSNFPPSWPALHRSRLSTRRQFLSASGLSLGAIAYGSLLGCPANAHEKGGADHPADAANRPLAAKSPPRAAQARRVIYLHMSGAPPQHELFDYKPKLIEHHLEPCPESLLKNQRFPFIKGHPQLLGTPYKFRQHGQSGAWISELLPGLSGHADDIAIVKSMHTTQFNHAPAEMFLFTGSPRFGGASLGSWLTYGLGSDNENLPGFVVLLSGGTDPTGGKSLWGSGFLPSVYQGVQCRSTGEPILYVNNPAGMNRDVRRRSLDTLRDLNQQELEHFGDPETSARIDQYELAFRMQMAVPEVMDINREPQHTLEAYGAQPGQASFANNCLLARRLIEQGVRYVQLFDWGWDIHGTNQSNDIVHELPRKCQETDRPIAALLTDLKQRGLLEDTLVVWGGEFGRTSMNEARNGSKFLGRDHHPHCFTLWLAGGGVKGGITHGETDELGYFIQSDPVGIHDLQATLLHLLGFDPHRFSHPYQGLEQRLIGPEGTAKIQTALLAKG